MHKLYSTLSFLGATFLSKLERDIASDIRGLREIIRLLQNFILLFSSDPIALNEFEGLRSKCS